MSRLRYSTAFIVLSLLASSLAACRSFNLHAPAPTPSAQATLTPTVQLSPLPSPTPTSVRGTISIWHPWQEAQAPALLRRIEEFHTLYPEVLFDVTYVPSLDLRASFEQAVLDGDGPQILIGPGEWGPPLYDQGMIADLSSFPGLEMLKTLNPAALEAVNYHSALLGLPLDISGIVLYRNQAVIPLAAASFEEMVAQSKAATQGRLVGAIMDRGFYFTGGHLFGLGGRLMDSAGLPAFNDEHGLAWVQLLQEFERLGPLVYYSDEDLQAFKEGRVGYITETTAKRSELADALGDSNLAIDPWPLYGGGALSGFVQGEYLYLNQSVLDQGSSPAWLFSLFMLTPASQAGLAAVGMIPAMRPDVISAAGFSAQVEDPLIAQAMRALDGGAPQPVLPSLPVYASQLDIALQTIFNGESSASQALQQAAEEITQALSAESTQTPTP